MNTYRLQLSTFTHKDAIIPICDVIITTTKSWTKYIDDLISEFDLKRVNFVIGENVVNSLDGHLIIKVYSYSEPKIITPHLKDMQVFHKKCAANFARLSGHLKTISKVEIL
jgi:hypothetical protein